MCVTALRSIPRYGPANGELLNANQVVEGAARIYMIYNRVGFWQSDEPIRRWT